MTAHWFRCLAMLVFCLSSFSALAGKTELNNYAPKSSIFANKIIHTADPSSAEEAGNISGYAAVRRNKVRLLYSRDQQTDVPSARGSWTYKVEYEIFKTSNPGAPLRGSLQISFGDGNDVYEQVAEHLFGSENIKLRVTNVSARHKATGASVFTDIADPAASALIPADIRLELIIETERYTYLDPQATASISFDASEKTAWWDFVPGAEEYDLEWVFIDHYDAPPTGVSAFAYKKPTRVRVPENSYKLEMAYPQGKLYLRVRPVGRFITTGSDYSHIQPGRWNELSDSPYLITATEKFEANKNWQFAATYAEDGKHKSVVNFMDGTMRSRQALTNLSSEEATLVAETKYDSEGRGVVTILPAPVQGDNPGYKANFNRNNGNSAFSSADFERGASNSISPLSGAGKYFSALNPFSLSEDPYRDYIPSAEGYPYAQVEYTRDNTGRIARSSGTGPGHKLRSGHDTRYFYGTANSTQLHRMFGSNAGKASHYGKTLAVDANGQVSVTYLDQEKRTIATALAGNAPSNLVALPGNVPENLTVNLVDNNVRDDANGTLRSVNKILNVAPNTPYAFTYDADGIIYNYNNTIGPTPNTCIDCEYTLEIRITDPKGRIVQIDDGGTMVNVFKRNFSNPAPPPDCNNSSYSIPAITLPAISFTEIGEYTVTKTLKVNLADLDVKIQNAIDAMGLGTNYLTTLIAQYASEVDECRCAETCEDHCRCKIKNEYPDIPPEIILIGAGGQEFPQPNPDFVALVAQCEQSQCSTFVTTEINTVENEACSGYLTAMLMDVSPPVANGQAGGNHYSGTYSADFWTRVSDAIFSEDIYLSKSDGTLLTSSAADIAYMQDPANWRKAWADDLVKLHREYCHYIACTLKAASKAYNVEMSLIADWTEAFNTGYLNPLGMSAAELLAAGAPAGIAAGNTDPVVSLAWGQAYVYTQLKTRLENYGGSGISLWEWLEPSYTSSLYTDDINTSTGMTDDQLKWRYFRGIYVQEKEKIIHEVISCTFYTDDAAIVKDALVYSNSANETNQLIADNLGAASLGCEDLCQAKADFWISQLNDDPECGYSFGFATKAQMLDLRNALYNFCIAECGPENPLALITQAMVTAGELDDIIAMLTSLSVGGANCGIEPIVDDMNGNFTSNPYTCTTVPAQTLYVIDECFDEFVDFLNYTFQAAPDVENFYYYNSNGFDFINCINNYKYYIDVPDYPISSHGVYKQSNYFEHCIYNPDGCYSGMRWLFVNSSTGTVINMSDIETITNYIVDPVTSGNITSPFDAKYTKIKMDLIVSGSPVSAYFYNTAFEYVESIIYPEVAICTVDIPYTVISDPCSTQLTAEATYNATQAYNKIIEDFTADFTAKYIAQCLPENDLFKYEYIESEYHYTLYYYDQAGNLVQTVPPEGVHLLDIATNFNSDGVWNGTNPVHTYKSEYDYNSLNQPVRQQTPDGGIARTWYNKKGQLMASQNAKQSATTYTDDALVQYKPYSYTRYDELGRTVESGELNVKKTQSLAEVSEAQQERLVNHEEFPNSAINGGVNEWELMVSKPKVQVTRMFYDEPLTASVSSEFGAKGQENLRSRAVSATFEERDDNNDATYDHASHYSYDVLGNVKTLLQENSALKNVGHDFKRLDYDYDLVSGNVNEVKYQDGQPDRFYHQYDYDADNRIIQAITSSDKMIYDRDAKYFYYKHGPLARTETGHDKVQGMDYAYTIQGWIKGMNSNTLKASRDIGKDAILSGKNAFTGTDAFGYTIGYFNNDYSPIATITAAEHFEAGSKTSAFANTYNLFNGNISHVIPAMMKPDETYLDILGNDYRYDQLNRLKSMEEFAAAGLRTSNSWSGATAQTDYKVNMSYDANGNITSLFRNAVGAMDDMTYSYVPNTNKLNYVSDAVASSNYATDIDNQSANNYDYDQIGNLIKDEQEEIASIEWTVYGKVKKITRDAGSVKPDLEFKYDAMGNRISKTVKPRTATGLTDETEWSTTFYTRDAQGNVMGIYEKNYQDMGPFEGIRATADFKISETQRAGTLYVSFSVNGVSIMTSVEWQGDAASTATAAAAAINSTLSNPDYTAIANGNVVTVTAPVGTAYNGYTLQSNLSAEFLVEFDYVNNFVGGMNAATFFKEEIRLKELPIYGSKRVGIKNNNILLDERSFVADISASSKEFVNITEASSQNYTSPGLSSLCGAGERGKGIIQLSGANQSYPDADVEFFVDGVSINQPVNWQGPAYTAAALANAISIANGFHSSAGKLSWD